MALDWLTTLGEKDSKAKSADFVAWHRFNRLASLVAERRYAPHNRSIQSLLTELEGEHDLRTALAHGRMSATTAGMALTWTGRDKGAWRRRTLTMTWLQAVETLYKLDKLQRDLASQLGQIKRHCLSKKAQNAA